MKKPNVIKFRCHCMECSNEDKPEAGAPKSIEQRRIKNIIGKTAQISASRRTRSKDC